MNPFSYYSYYPGQREQQNMDHARPRGSSNVGDSAMGVVQPQHQIQVNSTMDADIVLRRVIEDRAAILALKSRVATNEAELMKAKTRQLRITKILDRQDQDISKLATKAKRELAEYNEKSKQYIQSFMFAFENGDMDKLPRHHFVPPLEELELAINRRKATLIEKVQADDRVKKLEFVNSQERITMNVLKKNEEAFLRAIELSKQQFSDSCETWLNRVHKLLSVVPYQTQRFGDVSKRYTTDAHRPRVHVSRNAFRYSPLEECDVPLQYNHRGFAQNFETPRDKEASVTPERSAKRPIGHMSPARSIRAAGNFRPMCSGYPGDNECDLSPGPMKDESPENKRQKMECKIPSLPLVPGTAPIHNGAKIIDIDLYTDDRSMPNEQGDANREVNKHASAQHNATIDQDENISFQKESNKEPHQISGSDSKVSEHSSSQHNITCDQDARAFQKENNIDPHQNKSADPKADGKTGTDQDATVFQKERDMISHQKSGADHGVDGKTSADIDRDTLAFQKQNSMISHQTSGANSESDGRTSTYMDQDATKIREEHGEISHPINGANDPKVDEHRDTHRHDVARDQDAKDTMSIAKVLTNLHGDTFAVSNI